MFKVKTIRFFGRKLGGENVMVAAHGNSLRALVKHIEEIPVDPIGQLEIPTARPYVYEFDGQLKLLTHNVLNR